MQTLGVLYIALGDYHVFWDDFYKSSENFFLPEMEKTYFIFTDQPDIFKKYSGNIKVIETERKGWPYDTLLRFKFFVDAKDDLEKMDYLFFCNANLLFVDTVGLEVIPQSGILTVVNHPCFFNKYPCHFSYERRKKSTACVSPLEGRYYVAGGFNGGGCS